jgi:hypothetical protein
LTPSGAVLTLDYGTETAGFPFFSVQDISSAAQLESKYTEAQAGLDEPFGDGPWTFANGLSNTFRVETFNVTETGDYQSFFQQGGFRWQSLTLLGDTGNVTLCGAGLKSYNSHTLDNLPGSFNSSNTVWNEIWALGARTVQQACIANGSAPSTWEVVSTGADAGVLLRGQQPAQSVHGLGLANYTMSFSTNIVRGGTGWKVASTAQGYGPYFVLTSEYPADSTFLNTNRTLVPPNTLVVGYGYNLVNQTTLTTGPVVQYPVSFDVKEGLWYEISTSINQTGYTITIVDDNNSTASPIFVPLADFGSFVTTSGTPTQGTWSFGPYQDQTALVRDVQVYAQNGSLMYTNPMNNTSVLEEFGVMSNTHNVCLDGAKRDRLVWSGDFVHAHRIILASTNEQEFIAGTLAYLLEWQATSGPSSGLVSLSPGMGQSSDYAVSFYDSFALLDYQMLFLVAYSGYYLHSGDMAFLQSSWAQASKVVEALLTMIDPDSGLAVTSTIPGSLFFIGASNGTAPSALLKFSLDQMAMLATAVGDNQTASSWTSTAANISEAVNSQLWGDSLGTYAESLTSSTISSISGTAWAIIAGIANQTQTLSAIVALSGLRLGVGYKTDSAVDSSDPSVNLSPFLSGFLLESLFISLRDNSAGGSTYDNATTEAISVLLDQLWSAEVTQDEYYTGASWEYIFPDGSPGLGLFTSLSHPWGGAPTYILTEYLLGIQPASVGYSEWRFSPSLLNSTSWVSGRVQTPHGYIHGNWTLVGQDLNMNICSPEGTSGSVHLPFSVKKCVLDGQQTKVSQGAFQVDVSGGLCHSIDVVLG